MEIFRRWNLEQGRPDLTRTPLPCRMPRRSASHLFYIRLLYAFILSLLFHTAGISRKIRTRRFVTPLQSRSVRDERIVTAQKRKLLSIVPSDDRDNDPVVKRCYRRVGISLVCVERGF